MTEAFKLLDAQPDSWPRWQPGETVNGVTTSDRHLFMLELIGRFGHEFGRVYPACHFVDGATPVEYARNDRETNYEPLCPDCQEVELQHGLTMLDAT